MLAHKFPDPCSVDVLKLNKHFASSGFADGAGRDFDQLILTFPLPQTLSHYSGVIIPMVFQHSGGRDFDLPRHSHYSGVIPMVWFNIVTAV